MLVTSVTWARLDPLVHVSVIMTINRKANAWGDAKHRLPCSLTGFWWCILMETNLNCCFSDLMTCSAACAEDVRSNLLEGVTDWFCLFYWLKSEPWWLESSCVGSLQKEAEDFDRKKERYLKYVNTPFRVYAEFYSSYLVYDCMHYLLWWWCCEM